MFKLYIFTVAFTLCLTSYAQANNTASAEQFAALEKKIDARIGVFAVDTKSGEQMSYRANERFLMCSTFKLPLAAGVLHRVDQGSEKLDRFIPYEKKDLLSYAPITKKNLKKKGMTIADLAAAAVQYSDNTAANLLLKTVGGPGALTDYVQTLKDMTTRFDRFEPELNNPIVNQDLDTSTPEAMAKTLQTILTGDALKPKSRELLNDWLLTNTTGAKRLKAGLPAKWKIGDKTGTGFNGSTVNDIGIVYPPDGAPIIVVAFITNSKSKTAENEKALADIGRIISARFTVR